MASKSIDISELFRNMSVNSRINPVKCRHAMSKWLKHPPARSFSGLTDDGHHRYIARFFDSSKDPRSIEFKHELDLLSKFMAAGFTHMPTIRDVLYCGTFGWLVTESWDGDILDLIAVSRPKFMLDDIDEFEQQTHKLIDSFHNAGFSLGRINFKNIVFKYDVSEPEAYKLGLSGPWDHVDKLDRDDETNKIRDHDRVREFYLEVKGAVDAYLDGDEMSCNAQMASKISKVIKK